MKSRYVPLPNRRRTLSEMSPGVSATVSGMVVPAWPCSQDRGGRRSGRAADLLVTVGEHRPLRAPEGERLRREVDADGTEAAQHVRSQQTDRLPRHAEVGQCGCRQRLRGQWDTGHRPRRHTHRLRLPRTAHPRELGRRAAMGQVQLGGQVGVDDGLPGPGVDHERVRAGAVDADVDQFGHLARHRAHGDRNALGATAQRDGPGAAGGRRGKCEVHQRFDVDTVRDARPDKQGGGRDQCGQRGGHPVQRPRPASRSGAPWPAPVATRGRRRPGAVRPAATPTWSAW